jgi:CheY-like chemotaxis protein
MDGLPRVSPIMPHFPNVFPRERAFRPLIWAARSVANTGASCPTCGSDDFRRSLRRTFLDAAFACCFIAPFRCRACRTRFYWFLWFWRPTFNKPAQPPGLPVFIMPRQIFEIHPVDAYPAEPDSAEPNFAEPRRTPPERLLPPLVELPLTAAQPVRFIRLRSILILENDPSIRKLLRRLLHRRGYFTHEVLQPEDIPAELRERRVDLLIIDASLMGANGLDAALAPASVHPNLKILTLSVDSSGGAEIHGRCSALTKPFSSETFLESVDRLLEAATPPDNGIGP